MDWKTYLEAYALLKGNDYKNQHTQKNESGIVNVNEMAWFDFYEKMKVENADSFQMLDKILTLFVQLYPKEAKYLTVETLQDILREVREGK